MGSIRLAWKRQLAEALRHLKALSYYFELTDSTSLAVDPSSDSDGRSKAATCREILALELWFSGHSPFTEDLELDDSLTEGVKLYLAEGNRDLYSGRLGIASRNRGGKPFFWHSGLAGWGDPQRRAAATVPQESILFDLVVGEGLPPFGREGAGVQEWVTLFRKVYRIMRPGGIFLVGIGYETGSPSLGTGSLPGCLVQFATFEASMPSGEEGILIPAFRLKSRQVPNLPRDEAPNNYMVEEFSVQSTGERYFLLGLEKTTERIDEVHAREAAKEARLRVDEILSGTLERLLRARERGEESRLLRQVLAPSRGQGAYELMMRALFLQMLWDGYASGIDIGGSSVEFWPGYQSKRHGIMSAREEAARGPLHGYVFKRAQASRPSKDSISRVFLNIILDQKGFSDGEGTLLIPPSVHDWFVKHQPVTRTGRGIETLGLYLPTDENRRNAILRGYRASPGHYSIELLPVEEAGEGLYWGFQLARVLMNIPSAEGHASPYTRKVWPFVEGDGSEVVEKLERLAENGVGFKEVIDDLSLTVGGLRCILYSVFLWSLFQEDRDSQTGLPAWIDEYREKLTKRGFSSLAGRIDAGFKDYWAYLGRGGGEVGKPSALLWVAPPVQRAQARSGSLGSLLVISSHLLPASSVKLVQETLYSVYGSLRELEDTVEREEQARTVSQLEGELTTVESFSHEISKLASGIFRYQLKPIGDVFRFKHSEYKPENRDFAWLEPAGVLEVEGADREVVEGFRIADSPPLLTPLRHLLEIWASSKDLREELELDRTCSLPEAVARIVPLGVSAGVASNLVPVAKVPQSSAEIEGRLAVFKKDVDTLAAELMEIDWDGAEKLRWEGSASFLEVQAWFIRMLSAAVYNAVYHREREKSGLKLGIRKLSDDLLEISLWNAFRLDQRKDKVQVGTKNVLESCLRRLNAGHAVHDALYFGNDPDSKDRRWLTRMRFSYRHEGETRWLVQ